MRFLWLVWGSLVIGTPILAFMGTPLSGPIMDANRCIQCHGNLAPSHDLDKTAPELNQTFSMDWEMFEFTSEKRPPLSHPSSNYLPGKTFYDWDRQSMTEIYPEKCIDIFADGRDFPCQFTSVKNKTFLVRFNKQEPKEVDSCCKWSQGDFFSPRPDVLQNMIFDKKQALEGWKAEWWILDIPLPGPFGYGTYGHSNIPGAFWFPVISGWVQQDFSNYSSSRPDPIVFELPEMCKGTISVCKDS